MGLLKWLADGLAPSPTPAAGSNIISAGFCSLTYSYWLVERPDVEAEAGEDEASDAMRPGLQ